MNLMWSHIIDIPKEAELEHIQILSMCSIFSNIKWYSNALTTLEFGQDAKRGSEATFTDDSGVEAILDKLEMAGGARSQEIEKIAVRKAVPEREIQGMVLILRLYLQKKADDHIQLQKPQRLHPPPILLPVRRITRFQQYHFQNRPPHLLGHRVTKKTKRT